MKLHTIIVSTRPGRVGPAVGRWFHGFAEHHGQFQSRLVDLADFNLPVYDEAQHPRTGKYAHSHTKEWSACINEADAFAFVTPEYNYSPPPTFVNMISYLAKEWAYKPCGFVSYGGVSGGLRSVQMEKLIAGAVKLVPMAEGVAIPMVPSLLSEDKQTFNSNELIDTSAKQMLDELYKWAVALKPMRA